MEEVIEKGKGRKASREDGERVIERGGGGSHREKRESKNIVEGKGRKSSREKGEGVIVK